MRTNIEIDDKLMAEVMKIMGTKSKRETVETAFQTIIRRHRQLDMLELRGKVKWEGDLDAWRRD